MDAHYDVVIVGAGPSGLGIGSILQEMGCDSFVILEKEEVGSSFKKWPAEMRFITPSFPAQGFGQTDLNAIVPKTSPAFTLDQEHPTGKEYAEYLALIAEHFDLPVEEKTTVLTIEKNIETDCFTVVTSRKKIQAQFVVWAAGEYQYPNSNPFQGGDLAIHTSEVESWKDIPVSDHIVIGGYESGMDAAYHLCKFGSHVKVLAKTNTWEFDHSDPSVSLTPYTYNRISEKSISDDLELIGDTEVVCIVKQDGGYQVLSSDGRKFVCTEPPILATGFTGSTKLIKSLISFGEHGEALLTENDELIKTPGIFLAGPEIRHRSHIFCYIYKFRQRYAVVAKVLAERLKLNKDILDMYRQENFILDDLSMCGERCQC
ncbi:Pyridine nucleotide-disulphide oxidoreductase [Terribacillus halophilus]|uniref:Pyridine nucleotide-disulphide oxidoreductase n=1 Tax=Terribacillus halophilus TaxID=361279 RepID=A0A1G6PY62_9BACI|nr:NAD(P)/FAD-dependent oxidoreductase [Terribacillus halophilus]SDC85140.1 Pyridine nucleotide-disulphide oxidoreductase [Terribacillus halophilus]